MGGATVRIPYTEPTPVSGMPSNPVDGSNAVAPGIVKLAALPTPFAEPVAALPASVTVKPLEIFTLRTR